MKAIQLAMSFYPDRGAGEGYVGELALLLKQLGMEVLVVAIGKSDEKYIYEGLPVQRLSAEIIPRTDVSVFYREKDCDAAEKFGAILDDEHPDIVHIHARLYEISHPVLNEVKRRGIPLVFTYHIGTVSCLRGDLMYMGKKVCDGLLDVGTCSRCFLHKLGLPRPFADLTSAVPVWVGDKIGAIGLSGKLWTALRMRSLVSLYCVNVYEFFLKFDRIVVLCQWSQKLLIRNRVPKDKITYSSIGLPHQTQRFSRKLNEPPSNQSSSDRVRCIFLGRFNPSKGIDTLISAMRLVPDLPIELHLFDAGTGPVNESHSTVIKKMSHGDERIKFFSSIPNNNIVERLRSYDLLVVPSEILETGPFVVIEAFAAGVPVLGSKLGGIAELVKDGVNGLLVESGSVHAWVAAFQKICNDKGLLAKLKAGINPPRSMREVAVEMNDLYKSLFQNRSHAK